MGSSPSAMERDLLVQLTSRWAGRVAVKRDELDLDGHFDALLPDFPAHLSPPGRTPRFAAADPQAQQLTLAASWIAYNAKTSAVEEEIILPACRLLLEGQLPGRQDDLARTALHQTVIDEHYHVLMCMNAASVTRRRREIAGLEFDPGAWSVVRALRARRAEAPAGHADLVSLAFALAAESTINAFLLTVSQDRTIQPMNRMTVELHRQDESGHAAVFRDLGVHVHRKLDPEQREFFEHALRDGVAAFGSADHEAWARVAAVGGLGLSAAELADGAALVAPLPRDTGPLRQLLADLDIPEGRIL
jgi:alpha-N-dichloroacetyl-p-aminophenylserinol N-oxygenase